jgi:hypothetical protein
MAQQLQSFKLPYPEESMIGKQELIQGSREQVPTGMGTASESFKLVVGVNEPGDTQVSSAPCYYFHLGNGFDGVYVL